MTSKKKETLSLSEISLREERDFYKGIIDTANAIILTLDVKGKIVTFNPYMEALSGYKLQEVHGKDWFSIFLPTEDHENIRKMFLKAVKGIQTKGNVNPIITKKGEKVYVEWYDKTLKNSQGKVIGLLAIGYDVTERQKARDELIKSEEKYHRFFQVSPEAIIVVDEHGVILDINNRLYDWLGYKPEEIIGKHLLKIPSIPKESTLKALHVLEQRLAGVQVPPYELEFIHKDGTRKVGLVHATLIRDEQGALLHDLVLISDITESKRATQKLKESESLYRSTFDHAPIGILHVDLSGSFLKANNRACEFFGYQKKELFEKKFLELTHPEDVEKSIAMVQNLSSGQDDFFSLEKRYLKKDGSVVWSNTTVNLQLDADDNPLYFIVALEDITQRKKVESSLSESEEKYRLIYEQSKDAIMLLSPPDWKFISGNNAAVEMFKVKNEMDFVRMGPSEYSPKFQPDGQLSKIKAKEMIETAMRTGSHFFEWVHKTLEGEEFYATVLLTRIEFGGKKLLQATVRDISKEKEIDIIKADFVSLASHQLKTPLTTVRWYTEVLMKDSNLSESQRGLLDSAYDGLKRMTTMVNDLLNISRIESGAIYVEPKAVDITTLIQDIISSVAPLSESHCCRIEFKKPAENIPKIMIDASMFSQVLENVLSNAINYTSKDCRCKIIVALEKQKDDYIISVKDNGVGISQKNKSKVFTKFFRSRKAQKRNTSGSGLGLYISKKIMEAVGGSIRFESKEGKGTTFFITLPIKGMNSVKGEKPLV